jgi:hypothetical protein
MTPNNRPAEVAPTARDGHRGRAADVAREDLLTFVNAARAATGQDEFYESAEAAALSLDFLHTYLRVAHRRLYAQSLALGLNDFNALRVIEGLLADGRSTPAEHRAEEGALIRAALRRLPPQRVLALFGRLRTANVNNRRTRATIRDWLAARPDAAFDAVKYRRKVKAAVRHAHLAAPGELGKFLFQAKKMRGFTHPLFEAVRKARYSAEAIYELPYTVAEGFAGHHRVPRARFLERIHQQMTHTERQRSQQAAEAAGVVVEVDWTQALPTELVRYGLSLGPGPARDALQAALPEAARRIAHGWGLGRVAVVLDASYSMSGSRDKRRHPLAVAVAGRALLQAGCRALAVHWTRGGEAARGELEMSPESQTNLADPLLDALAGGPELLLIISDGVDNDPPGGAEAVLKGWRHLDPGGSVRIVHLNPVFDSGSLGPRPLCEGVVTVGLRTAEEIPLALALAGVEGDVADWIAPWVDRFIRGQA